MIELAHLRDSLFALFTLTSLSLLLFRIEFIFTFIEEVLQVDLRGGLINRFRLRVHASSNRSNRLQALEADSVQDLHFLPQCLCEEDCARFERFEAFRVDGGELVL